MKRKKFTRKARNGFQFWEDRAYRFEENQRFVTGEDTEDCIDSWLSDKFQGHEHVMDLGCGTGRYTCTIASMVGSIVAADKSPSMLKQVCRATKNITVQMEDCYCTSFTSESFDVVFLGNLLHIVAEPERVMLEVFRLVRPGGFVIAVDYTMEGMQHAAKLNMLIRYLKVWGFPPGNSQNLGREGLTMLAESAGFQVLESVLVGKDVKAACMQAQKLCC